MVQFVKDLVRYEGAKSIWYQQSLNVYLTEEYAKKRNNISIIYHDVIDA